MTDSPAPPDLGDAKALLERTSSPADLRALLDLPGVDDALIDRLVDEAGADEALDRVFGLMGDHFVPERAGAGGGVVRWDVATPSGVRPYTLTIADGAARGERGAAAAPRMTLALSAATLLRMCSGRLNGVTAFTGGKIKLTGDMMFGAQMVGWFDY
ncbi:SCP2 sterol-binding domain-containing protein [Actinomadura parmotrematis]|uniref:SCP2 sterol-binding domain-containing protein n=1 Tax=Actinomadura parmotrematis TaxID=2864039 RepID=A0ABS7G3T8_9ACTN|nr:SCP2 sterol-binding domain-containing protein [Actinomadura parmotrematis]MBW8487386.1 SCP2 sterol-binding domain-containing protein [Actinomadura parmotrematis]